MVKPFIKFGLINITCIINLVSILLVANHWFSIKPLITKIIIFTFIGLGILSTVLLSTLSLNYDIYVKILDILNVISFVIFGICVLSAIIKIKILGIDRGSTAYAMYSLPAVLPMISGVILFVLKK